MDKETRRRGGRMGSCKSGHAPDPSALWETGTLSAQSTVHLPFAVGRERGRSLSGQRCPQKVGVQRQARRESSLIRTRGAG